MKLGNGDGSFTEGSSYESGASYPPGYTLGDFKSDTYLDVVTSSSPNATANAIVVHFGDGAGHFTRGPSSDLGAFGYFTMSAADMNGDGKTDLVVDGAGVYLGGGNGTFLRTHAFEGGVAAKVHDFNHDGKLDVATVTTEWSLHVMLGNGDGTLVERVRYLVGDNPWDLDAADVDGDGNLDLLVMGTQANTVAVLLGNADGTFEPARFYLSGRNGLRIAAADFDRDTKIDFVTLDAAVLSFVRGNGDGTFTAYRAWHTNGNLPVTQPGMEARDLVVADMNGDQKPDAVFLQKSTSPGGTDIAVMLNDGTGGLPSPILTSGPAAGPLVLADVDNDQDLDVVTLSTAGTTAYTFLGDGEGGFAAPLTRALSDAGKPFVGQFTGDANPDLLITQNLKTVVYPGNGNGTFGSGISSGTPRAERSVTVPEKHVRAEDRVSYPVTVDVGGGRCLVVPAERGRRRLHREAHRGAERAVAVAESGLRAGRVARQDVELPVAILTGCSRVPRDAARSALLLLLESRSALRTPDGRGRGLAPHAHDRLRFHRDLRPSRFHRRTAGASF